MERSVGLVIITKLVDCYAVLLKKRGQYTKKGKPESYPGCLQISCHRKFAENKDSYDVLIRETSKKLGEDFATMLQGVSLCEIMHNTGHKNQMITYAAFFPKEQLITIKFNSGLVYTPENEIEQIVPITSDMKLFGNPTEEPAMFMDQIEIVKKALHIIKQSSN